jgi:hypothetical protein
MAFRDSVLNAVEGGKKQQSAQNADDQRPDEANHSVAPGMHLM